MYCIKCGNEVNRDDKFCTYCGSFLLSSDNVSNREDNVSDNMALIMGIFALIFFWIPVISVPLAITCIIKGNEYNKKVNCRSSSTKLGVVSIILSIIFLVLFIIFIFLVVTYVDDTQYNDTENTIEEHYNGDGVVVDGYKWLAAGDSVLYLNRDNSYIWYLDKNNFYSGIYEFYVGEEAIEYIVTNLSEYGVTLDDQLDFFRDGSIKIENYCLLILDCDNIHLDGDGTDSVGEVPYYGFYDEYNDALSLVNMETKDTFSFVRGDRIGGFDNSI